MTVVLSELGDFTVSDGSGDGLWLSAAEAAQATGWELKPEGLCRDDLCIPVPSGKEGDFVDGGNVNLTAFWAHMGKPAVRSKDGAVWSLGEGADQRGESLRSLEAPDFTLPDLDGKLHRLSDHKGKKVLLATWASW